MTAIILALQTPIYFLKSKQALHKRCFRAFAELVFLFLLNQYVFAGTVLFYSPLIIGVKLFYHSGNLCGEIVNTLFDSLALFKANE